MSSSDKKNKRQLAAIVFSDITGYTAMMHKDETASMVLLERYKECHEAESARYNGSIIQYYGDACLMTFQSSVEAVKCGEALQLAFREEPKVPVRVGIHLGDIVHTDGNIFGDAVNVASRVESMGIPGTVLFSESVLKSIRSHPEFKYQSLGTFEFKNVEEPLEVFALTNHGFPVPRKDQMKGKLKEQPTDIPESKLNLKRIIPYVLGLFVLGALVWYFTNSSDKSEPDNNLSNEMAGVQIPIVENEDIQAVDLAPFTTGTFTDKRDGKNYKWVKYSNGQKWMTQNLNYKLGKAPCYDNSGSCDDLGRLYTWSQAVKACPASWKLPSEEDWRELDNLAGREKVSFATLSDKEKSGFEMQFGGSLDDVGMFNYKGESGNFWTGTEVDPLRGWQVLVSNTLKEIFVVPEIKKLAFSCRCIEDNSNTITSSHNQNNSGSASKNQPSSTTISKPVNELKSESNSSQGNIRLEVYDSKNGNYRMVPIQSKPENAISGDLKIGSKKHSTPSIESGIKMFESKEIIPSSSTYRLFTSGSVYAYELSPQAGENLVSINSHNDKNVGAVDADLKISKPSKPSNKENVEERLVLISKSKIDINKILSQIGNSDDYLLKLKQILGDKMVNASNINVTSSGGIVSFDLGNNETEILPIVIYVPKK